MEREQIANRTLVILLTIAVSIYLLEKLGGAAAALGNIILLLALSWLLAFTLQPAVDWLRRGILPRRVVEWVRRRSGDPQAEWLARLRLPYGLAVIVVYLLILAALVYGVLNLVPVVIDQIGQLASSIQRLARDLPGSFQRILDWINSVRQTLIDNFNLAPDAIQLPSTEELIRQAGNIVSSLGKFVLDLAGGIVAFLSQVVLVLLISAYMMIDGRGLLQQLLHVLPDRIAENTRLWIATIDRTFGGFIRGTLLQSVIYGAFVTTAMLVFGLQFALVVGVATGVLMLIPILGGLIGLAVPLLAGLLQSSPNTLWLVLLLFAFQLILFNLIMPRILSQSLRMPTLLVFIALVVGGQLMGVWGLIFAVPAAGVLYSVGQLLLHRAKYHVDRPPSED
ncbi:MAG TPA: AI-2E family transporter, partial [Anaerolineae bacterium]|nr:AI-2E family transporter [Anaerolineae bacterium]